MVGYRNPTSLLQCNTYVRQFKHGGYDFNVCVDPGSRFDFAVVEQNVTRLVGGLDQINCLTINHQDPDVTGNTPSFCGANPHAEMIVSEESWRLLQHLMLKPGNLRLANMGQSNVSITGPYHLQLVPTPFCHFRGSMAFYDPELRTLFSGDLFGGLNRVGATHLVATEEDWAGIAQFHQIYMPSREVLRYAVRQILNLRPRVEIIAPQHGHIITGDLVEEFLDRMHELRVGNDLLAEDWDVENLDGYRNVLEQLIRFAEDVLGPVEVACRMNDAEIKDDLESVLRFHDGELHLEREGFSAVGKTFARLAAGEARPSLPDMQAVVLRACDELSLPVPPIEVGLQEGH
jgi:serine/threonine-protein kinase